MRSSSLPARSFSRSFSRVRSALSLGSGLRRHQQVEQAVLGVRFGAVGHFVQALLAHHVDGDVHQVADHRLDVAADVADFGELAGLHLQERRVGQLRQPARDFGLADAGGADHEDVLRHHLLGHFGRQLLAADAVAQRDGDGALGVGLADDVLVEFAHDLARRQFVEQRLFVRRTGGQIDDHGLAQLLVGDVLVGVDADLAGDLHGLLGDLRGRPAWCCAAARWRRPWRRGRRSRWRRTPSSGSITSPLPLTM